MEHLPVYIGSVFAAGALFTLVVLYKASHNAKPFLLAVLLWLALQSIVSLSGFYTVITGRPPRFPLLLLPSLVFITMLFLTKKGRRFINGFDVKIVTLLHVVRIPVELTLYWLYLYKYIPQVMTFEGRNFDILCGLTAPLVYYFGYRKQVLNRYVLLAWNIVCLLLLINIVGTAILSVPLPFQRLAFDQPAVALFYFPFIWLPGFIVPAVLLAHLVSIRQLIGLAGREQPVMG